MKINESILKNAILSNYGFSVERLIPLSGFFDKNYEMVCGNQKYFLKIYGFDKLPAIRFQLDFIQKCIQAQIPVAKIIPTKKNKLLFSLSSRLGVIQEFLPGKQLRTVKMTAARLERAGSLLGRLHRMTYKNTFRGAVWKKYAWDLSQFKLVVDDYPLAKKYLAPEIRLLVEGVIGQWRKRKLGLKQLRKGVCHNDFHHGNILLTNRGQLAITDFGDAMMTWYVADVAIALAHLCFEFEKVGTPDSLMKAFLKGYSTQFTLTKLEKEYLPLLVQMRAVTVIIEVPLHLKKENQHELYDRIVATKKNVLEYFSKK